MYEEGPEKHIFFNKNVKVCSIWNMTEYFPHHCLLTANKIYLTSPAVFYVSMHQIMFLFYKCLDKPLCYANK